MRALARCARLSSEEQLQAQKGTCIEASLRNEQLGQLGSHAVKVLCRPGAQINVRQGVSAVLTSSQRQVWALQCMGVAHSTAELRRACSMQCASCGPASTRTCAVAGLPDQHKLRLRGDALQQRALQWLGLGGRDGAVAHHLRGVGRDGEFRGLGAILQLLTSDGSQWQQ